MTKLIGRAAVMLTITALFLIEAAVAAPAQPFFVEGETSIVDGDPFSEEGAITVGTGTGTPLGDFISEGTVQFTPLGKHRLRGVGTQTFITPDGEVYSKFTGVLDTRTGEAVVHFVIVGGSGEFEDARGQFKADVQALPDGITFVFTGSGKIKY